VLGLRPNEWWQLTAGMAVVQTQWQSITAKNAWGFPSRPLKTLIYESWGTMKYFRSDVLTAAMSMLFFWVATPCGLVGRNQSYVETYCLDLILWKCRQHVSPKHLSEEQNCHYEITALHRNMCYVIKHVNLNLQMHAWHTFYQAWNKMDFAQMDSITTKHFTKYRMWPVSQ
jgi:hypothetical protein